MNKLLNIGLLSIIFLTACDNVSFGSNSSLRNSTSSSTNEVSSNQNSSSSMSSLTYSSSLVEDNNNIDYYLDIFVKAFKGELSGNYRYHMTSNYADKIMQKSDKQIWTKTNGYIYNYSNYELNAYVPNAKFSYIKYNEKNYYYSCGIEEQNIINFVNNNKNIVNEGIYGKYKIMVYNEIYENENSTTLAFVVDDPLFSNDDNYYFRLFSSIDESLFVINDYITSDEYYEYVINESNKIVFDNEYQLLDKIENYPSSDKYYMIPGFGISAYSDIKYGIEGNFGAVYRNRASIVYFEVQGFPDLGFSKGEHITGFYVTDKSFKFNDLTLESSVEEISALFTSLGYTLSESIENEEMKYSFYNGGINISLYMKENIPVAISFYVNISNVQNIIF